MKKNNNDEMRILIATFLSTIFIIGWIRWYGAKTLPPEMLKKPVAEKKVEKNETDIIKKEEVRSVENVVEPPKNVKKIKIKTDLLSGSINTMGLVFDDLTLNEYKVNIDGEEKIKLLNDYKSDNAFYFNFGWSGDETEFPSKNTIWKASRDVLEVEKPVIFSYTNKDKVLFQVIVSVDKNYMFNVKQVVKNNGKKTILVKARNVLSKKTLETADVGVHTGFIGAVKDEVEEVKYDKIKKKDLQFNDIKWAGWTDRYWLVAITGDYSTNLYFQNDSLYNIEFKTANKELAPNEEFTTTSNAFTGAKVLKMLDIYKTEYNLPLFDRAIDFGWYYFITRPMYLVLKIFYNLVGNFGLSIIILTLLIKCLLFPLANKSFISMAKIKKLQPKIDAIKQRAGNDKMKLNQETMALYKKENVSPLSGCLPMLIQIPILFSLYKVFSITIDMRQAPFYGYIKDLAAKDPTNLLNLFGLLPYQVTFLEIGFLPCLMALSTWLQQKMAGTDKGSNQAEIATATKIMPIIFLFLFAGMPTGLLIYWTFSNLLSILQQYIVEKRVK